jgi:hypothetical protein
MHSFKALALSSSPAGLVGHGHFNSYIEELKLQWLLHARGHAGHAMTSGMRQLLQSNFLSHITQQPTKS